MVGSRNAGQFRSCRYPNGTLLKYRVHFWMQVKVKWKKLAKPELKSNSSLSQQHNAQGKRRKIRVLPCALHAADTWIIFVMCTRHIYSCSWKSLILLFLYFSLVSSTATRNRLKQLLNSNEASYFWTSSNFPTATDLNISQKCIQDTQEYVAAYNNRSSWAVKSK